MCPWGKCAFCESYKQRRFEKRSVVEIKEDIDIIRKIKDEIVALSWQKGFGGEINDRLIGTYFFNAGYRIFLRVLQSGFISGEEMFLSRTQTLWL